MNGENLVYDYRFNVVDEPSEWAFNWDYSECGTPNPTPRENWATMWMVQMVDDPLLNIKRLFCQLGRQLPIKLKVLQCSEDYVGDGDPCLYKFTVVHKTNREIIMRGEMDLPDDGSHDPNVGLYAVFRATTKYGTTIMRSIYKNTAQGTIALVPHKSVEIMLDNGYQVVITTGEGINERDEDYSLNDDFEQLSERLSTRFTLFHEDEEVARCHMSYRDGSYDPSMGPTIEMIAVKQSRRGEGLANVVWYWVLWFISNNFTIECLHNDSPVKHVMIKATQIMTQEVELRQRKRDGDLWPVGFKELLYNYCGFSVRVQKGAMASLFASKRPQDEE